MADSSLVCYEAYTDNKSSRDGKKIIKITPHHMACNMTIENCLRAFQNPSRGASATYCIGTDGRIGQGVEEYYRPWTSSSYANDSIAVTMEVANDGGAPDWHISDAALESLINLCEDICRRNGIKELVFTGDASGNLTQHNYFSATACVPVDTELLTPNGWKKLSDIKIGDTVAAPDLENLNITFEEVYDKVPVKKQDTYTCNELTATKDHRMVYCTQSNKTFRIEFYNELLKQCQQYIPLAGTNKFAGLPLSDDMIKFYIAVQADGHYYNENGNYYGLQFHLKKERKINAIKEILDSIHLEYKENKKSDGSTTITVWNFDNINIVKDICEKYLCDKCFTWEWLNMSKEQATLFLDEILNWDGCRSANKYTSRQSINLDIVNAIAACNGKGSRIVGNDVLFRDLPYTTIGKDAEQRRNQNQDVSCVSVKTGLILIRQNGKTFIVGNCPGPYLKSKFPYIAEQVNARLNGGGSYTRTIQAPDCSVCYSAYDATHKWLDTVKDYNETNGNGYAGYDGFPIQGIACSLTQGHIVYRVHTINGQWLDWVKDLDKDQGGFAGLYGKNIDGVQMYLDGLDSSYKVQYRVRTLGGQYLDWVTNYGSGNDGYAGLLGKPIDRIQVRIMKTETVVIEPKVETPVEQPVETPIETPITTEPVIETPPVETPTETPVETPTEPVETPTETPTDEPVIEQPVEEPIEKPTEQPVDKPTDEPVETEKPVETPVEPEIPAEPIVPEPPVEQPVEINKPIETPTEPTDEPVDKPTETDKSAEPNVTIKDVTTYNIFAALVELIIKLIKIFKGNK